MKLFTAVAQLKVYFSRAGMYISIINFMLLLATFKLTYNINISAFVIVPLGVIFTLLIGYLDYRLIFVQEIIHANKQSDIKKQLNKIEEMIRNNR